MLFTTPQVALCRGRSMSPFVAPMLYHTIILAMLLMSLLRHMKNANLTGMMLRSSRFPSRRLGAWVTSAFNNLRSIAQDMFLQGKGRSTGWYYHMLRYRLERSLSFHIADNCLLALGTQSGLNSLRCRRSGGDQDRARQQPLGS